MLPREPISSDSSSRPVALPALRRWTCKEKTTGWLVRRATPWLRHPTSQARIQRSLLSLAVPTQVSSATVLNSPISHRSRSPQRSNRFEKDKTNKKRTRTHATTPVKSCVRAGMEHERDAAQKESQGFPHPRNQLALAWAQSAKLALTVPDR